MATVKGPWPTLWDSMYEASRQYEAKVDSIWQYNKDVFGDHA